MDDEFGLKVGRMKAYRAKDTALEGIFGKAGLQYRKLFYYKFELEWTHPDSSVHLHYENFRDPDTVGPRFLVLLLLGPFEKGLDALLLSNYLPRCLLFARYVYGSTDDGYWN